jgi:hypothetical protein
MSWAAAVIGAELRARGVVAGRSFRLAIALTVLGCNLIAESAAPQDVDWPLQWIVGRLAPYGADRAQSLQLEEWRRSRMKYMVLDPRMFAFIVGTRAALGVGIGLLVSGTLAGARRRAIGVTLVAIGAATTIPAVISVLRSRRRFRGVDRDRGLIGATRFPRKGDEVI